MKNENPEINNIQDDEIDLFELWQGLVDQKWLIGLVSLSVLILGFIYVQVTPKVYKIEASMVAPLPSDINSLKFPNSPAVTSNEIFSAFLFELTNSRYYAEAVHDDAELKAFLSADNTSIEQIKELLSEMVSFNNTLQNKKGEIFSIDKPFVMNIEVKNDASMGLRFADSIVEFAAQRTKKHVKSELFTNLSTQIKNNKVLIENEMERFSMEREAKLVVLSEALAIAKKLGIAKPVSPTEYKQTSVNSQKIDVVSNTPTSYWLGSEVLAAEIEGIQSRKTELHYSSKLRVLTQKNRELNKALLNIAKVDFTTHEMISSPYAKHNPIKPKTQLILAVSAVLGLMLGVFIALIRRAYQHRKLA